MFEFTHDKKICGLVFNDCFINCPKGILCGRRLKTRVGESGVRSFVRHRFLGISSINSWHANNIFGRYNQGIRDHLKSGDCQLLSFIGYSAQHATRQKHMVFDTKFTPRKWTVFAKLTILGSVLSVRFKFCVNIFERRPHKMTFGPPLPRGCYLV